MDIIFEDFVGVGVLNEVNPIRIGYEGMAVFDESGSTPSQEDVDLLILTAFQQPNVATLLNMLQALPAGNPFSSTSSVQYIQGMELSVPKRVKRDTSRSSSISAATVVVIMGIVGSVLLLGVLILRKRLRDPLRKYRDSKVDVEDRDAEESYCTSSVGPASDDHSFSFKNDEQTQADFAPESDMSRTSSGCDPVFKNPLLRSLQRKYKAVPRKPATGRDNESHGSDDTVLTSSGTRESDVYQCNLIDEEETEIVFLPDSEANSASSDCDDYQSKSPMALFWPI